MADTGSQITRKAKRPRNAEVPGFTPNTLSVQAELPEAQKRQIVEAITDQIIIDRDGIEIRLLQLSQFSKSVAKGGSDPGVSCLLIVA